MTLKVLVIGGGIGGLCLAQGLRKAGIEAAVYEREPDVASRGQGYRFRIDADGDRALRECLPTDLYDLYHATTNRPSHPPIGAFDHELNLIYRLDQGVAGTTPPQNHIAVNRLTLRQVLLGGLNDAVHFDHALTSFEQDADGVRATFANGQTATGDILVAADGIQSVVRRQLVPEARLYDTGMRCIYGKTLLNDDILARMPEPLFAGFTPVIGPDRCTLALGMFRPCRPPEEAAPELAPHVRMDPVPDYLMWMLVAPEGALGQGDDVRTPERLHRIACERIHDWHPDLRYLVERADVHATFPIAIRTSLPVAPWTSGRVTLLGDAIHAMTPAGGIGANTALRDAAELTARLTDAVSGKMDVIAAIASYESAMCDYGFAAVKRSLQGAANLYRISLPPEEISYR